jgi:hypothetical protein
MGLAFAFTEKCLLTVKISRKSVFHPHETHILSRIDISVLYNFFRGFEKYRISTQNPKGLAFGFTEKHLFTTKTS